jgi:hypothetical protein
MTAWLFVTLPIPVWQYIILVAFFIASGFIIRYFDSKKNIVDCAAYFRDGINNGFAIGNKDALHKVAVSIDSGCELKEIRMALEHYEIPVRERNDSDWLN